MAMQMLSAPAAELRELHKRKAAQQAAELAQAHPAQHESTLHATVMDAQDAQAPAGRPANGQRAGRRGATRRVTTSVLPNACTSSRSQSRSASPGAPQQRARPGTEPAASSQPPAPARAESANAAAVDAAGAASGAPPDTSPQQQPAAGLPHSTMPPDGSAASFRAASPAAHTGADTQQHLVANSHSRGSTPPMLHYHHLKQMARDMQDHVRTMSASRRLERCEGDLTEYLRAIRCRSVTKLSSRCRRSHVSMGHRMCGCMAAAVSGELIRIIASKPLGTCSATTRA